MTRQLVRGPTARTTVLAVLTLLLTAPALHLAHAQALPGPELQAALDAVVSGPDTVFQGAVLAVQRPGQPLWTGAAGVTDLETRTPLPPGARFRVGSIAKVFVATVVLQLAEEGTLSLNDPMTALLPSSVTDRFDASDRTTVRMLLNHTSGIPEWLDDEVHAFIAANPTKVWDTTEFLDLAAAKPRAFEPGTGWAYSNTDYNLLGMIIERATGDTWRDEVTARIFEPLQLTYTSLPQPGDTAIDGVYMHGYGVADGAIVDQSHVDPSMAGAAGGSALITNTSDLTTFITALLAGKLFRDPATLDAMMSFVDTPGEQGQTGYGLGLERYVLPGDLLVIGHSGGTAGYLSFVGTFPDLELTMALSVDAQVDPTPVIVAALKVLAPPPTAAHGPGPIAAAFYPLSPPAVSPAMK